jgi:hypothetical protein
VVTIGVKGHKARRKEAAVGKRVVLALTGVANDQLAAFMRGGQMHHEGCKHVGDFFGIAVGGEKRARFVHQQLIGFKGDLTVGETQRFANLVDGGPQRLVPLRIAQCEIICRDLPTPTHFRIHNRLFPTAIGSEFAHLNERFSLVFR